MMFGGGKKAMQIQTNSKSVEKNMLTLKLGRWNAYINFRQSRLQSKENYQDYRGATCNEKKSQFCIIFPKT